MKKLLIICGPTATGKTKLALHLAKIFDGEVISADSRQVYKGMDIGTGKGIPKNSKFEIRNSKLGGYYKVAEVKVWGYDLVEPKEEFSVAQYIKIARGIINHIWEKGKLPILVGGTGLYIKAVVDGIPTALIPQNKALRSSLESKRPDGLYELLAQLDPVKAASMNISDRKNPRRLIRAIEIADAKIKLGESEKVKKIDALFIGLTAPRRVLYRAIDQRVDNRIKRGFEKEVGKLLKSGVSWNSQSMTSLGYRQWKDYVLGRKERRKAIADWKREETKYAKRQLTWFKKDKRINWFDVSKSGWKRRVEKMAKKWYSS